MSDLDVRLWRVAHRGVLVLVIGVLGLLVGLGPRPQRSDSLYGLIIVLMVTVPVLVTVLRLPTPARSALRFLPRHRPLLAITAALSGAAAALVAWWAVVNALVPGTLSPLALALVAAVLAGTTALAGRVSRRLRGPAKRPRQGRGGGRIRRGGRSTRRARW